MWRDIVDTNVNGPFLMPRAAVPALVASGRGRGRIINISINHEIMRRAGFPPYGPSKAALESETIICAQDLASTGVTVNALLPGGATETGLTPASVDPEARATMLRPAIVVPPLLWLASDASRAFTGPADQCQALAIRPTLGRRRMGGVGDGRLGRRVDLWQRPPVERDGAKR